MTGFGSALELNPETGAGFKMEISSVNRKQFEIKFALPHELAAYESKLRLAVGSKISRGSITLRVNFRDAGGTGANGPRINLAILETLAHAARRTAEKTGVTMEAAAQLLTIEGVADCGSADYDTPETEQLLYAVTEKALLEYNKMREREGGNLAKDIAMRLEILKDSLAKIEPLVKDFPERQYQKLLARLKEFKLASPDDERLTRELVIFSDKADVTEEITRLHSHFSHFAELMKKHDEPVGRQLDFMTQEIFREINTLGNKAASQEISPVIVTMKTELEKSENKTNIE